MNLPMKTRESVKAVKVARPETARTALTSKPTSRATNTVAGNIVSTCWKPNNTICPKGGASLGK